jgi:hypothetical protein
MKGDCAGNGGIKWVEMLRLASGTAGLTKQIPPAPLFPIVFGSFLACHCYVLDLLLFSTIALTKSCVLIMDVAKIKPYVIWTYVI